jgi:hypothetical protein
LRAFLVPWVKSVIHDFIMPEEGKKDYKPEARKNDFPLSFYGFLL